MNTVTNKGKWPVVHPGTILKLYFMDENHITGYRLAKEIGMPQTAISEIVNGKRRISPEMALRFSAYFGNSPEFWLNLQEKYDLDIAKEKSKAILKNIKPFDWIVAERP